MNYAPAALRMLPSSVRIREPFRRFKWTYGNPVVVPAVDARRSYQKRFLDRAVDDSAEAFFDVKAAEWLADTHWVSSMSAITAHPAFAQIKSEVGDRALGFILKRMERGSVYLQWFPLLRDLAGVDPVPADQRGYVPQMTAAWLQWGRQTGRI